MRLRESESKRETATANNALAINSTVMSTDK